MFSYYVSWVYVYQVINEETGRVIIGLSDRAFVKAGKSRWVEIGIEAMLKVHTMGGSVRDLQRCKLDGVIGGVRTGRKVASIMEDDENGGEHE